MNELLSEQGHLCTCDMDGFLRRQGHATGCPVARVRTCDVCGKTLVPYYGTWVCPEGLEE